MWLGFSSSPSISSIFCHAADQSQGACAGDELLLSYIPGQELVTLKDWQGVAVFLKEVVRNRLPEFASGGPDLTLMILCNVNDFIKVVNIYQVPLCASQQPCGVPRGTVLWS